MIARECSAQRYVCGGLYDLGAIEYMHTKARIYFEARESRAEAKVNILLNLLEPEFTHAALPRRAPPNICRYPP
jgi:hypothetical protein